MMSDEERDLVAKKIIKYRAIHGLRQKDLSKQLGCSTTTLIHIEKRDKTVKEITIASILTKLGLED